MKDSKFILGMTGIIGATTIITTGIIARAVVNKKDLDKDKSQFQEIKTIEMTELERKKANMQGESKAWQARKEALREECSKLQSEIDSLEDIKRELVKGEHGALIGMLGDIRTDLNVQYEQMANMTETIGMALQQQ